jgi:hypothetical protein
MFKFNLKKENKDKKGFTLLFAVLVSTLVLAVGASIISMALRQVLLSGVGRDSQFAFYASNTGIECALYWDLNGGVVFATSSASEDPNNVVCAGNDAEVTVEDDTVPGSSDSATSRFRIVFGDESDEDIGVGNNAQMQNIDLPYCVDVSVTKFATTTTDGRNRIGTDILARGYNTCDPENPRRIERGLELSY